MPAPANLSFETAGAGSGEAADWTVAFTATFEELNGFGVRDDPFEDFETQWSNDGYLFAFAGGDIEAAQFADAAFPFVRSSEGFDVLWLGNEGYLYNLAATASAAFGAEDLEGFETGWGNTTFLIAFTGGDLFAGTSDSFESGWQNDSYLFSLGATSNAVFDGPAPEAFEDFEQVFPLRTFEPDVALDTLTSTAHGFVTDQALTLVVEGTLPAPLLTSVTYYARSVTANTLKLSLSAGGAAIDLLDTGSGVRQLQADPARYWTQQMTTL